ncbi:hypothetical protein HK100_003529, partial [Physocladia obscura]
MPANLDGIALRRSALFDASTLNAKLLANWTNPPYGPTAWEFWHKESVLHPATDFAFCAVETSTGRIIGSIISRFRDTTFRPSDLVRPFALTEVEKEEVQWRAYSDAERENIEVFMNMSGERYEAGAIEAQQFLPEGRAFLHVRQMMVDEDFRGRGIGGALLGLVLAEARARGCAVQLESWGKGRAFYKKYGSTDAGPIFPVGFDGKVADVEQSCMVWYV